MKDSLFTETKPTEKNLSKPKREEPQFRPDVESGQKDLGSMGLDGLIDVLNDVVGTDNHESEEFSIPELPAGGLLSVVLISNWGSRDQVGLNGIEIFGEDG